MSRRWSKEDAIYDTISGMARRLGSGGRMPTISQLCETLSISRSTLDRVLRKLESNNIVRRKHGSGIFVSELIGRKTLGLVIGHKVFDSNHSQFWILMLQAAQELTKRNKDEIRFYFDCPTLESGEREGVHIFEDLYNERLDGLLSIALAPQREWLEQFELPKVGYGDTGNEPCTVSLNNEVGYRFAAQSLIEVGCQSFGFFGLYPVISGKRNSQRFREGLQVDGFTLDEDNVFNLKRFDFDKNHYEMGRFLAEEMFRKDGSLKEYPAKLDGISISDDLLAKGFLDTLTLMGVNFRDHFHIATMANRGATTLQLFEKQLHLVQFPVDDVMVMMLELLDMLMNGRMSRAPHRVIDPILVRASQ